MAKWIAFPHADKAYQHTETTLKKHWARLHRGDCEPLSARWELVGRDGIEPSTNWLKASCSTAELTARPGKAAHHSGSAAGDHRGESPSARLGR